MRYPRPFKVVKKKCFDEPRGLQVRKKKILKRKIGSKWCQFGMNIQRL